MCGSFTPSPIERKLLFTPGKEKGDTRSGSKAVVWSPLHYNIEIFFICTMAQASIHNPIYAVLTFPTQMQNFTFFPAGFVCVLPSFPSCHYLPVPVYPSHFGVGQFDEHPLYSESFIKLWDDTRLKTEPQSAPIVQDNEKLLIKECKCLNGGTTVWLWVN